MIRSSIPKIIWQTYKSMPQLPKESLGCIPTWIDSNPEWVYHFCSDAEIRIFFEVFLDGAYLDLFDAMPLPVMKADLWRYAVLYQFGGFYADIDTVCCVPLEDWVERDKAGLHVACENDETFFCQWALGARRGHPLLKVTLELIRERIARDGGVNESRPHYIHYYTGPALWSDAIRKYLGEEGHPIDIYERPHIWLSRDMMIYSSRSFETGKIFHFNASQHWIGSSDAYPSWQLSRKDLGVIASAS